MQTVIVMCGFPRSGKTTYSKTQLQGYVRVSIDDVIEMTTQTFNIKFGKFYQKVENFMIKELVSKEFNIVIDRTSLTKKSRKRTINKVISASHSSNLPRPFLKLIIIETPLDICIERNIQTGKVPKGIFWQMYRSFEKPTLDEGWDEIIKIKGN